MENKLIVICVTDQRKSRPLTHHQNTMFNHVPFLPAVMILDSYNLLKEPSIRLQLEVKTHYTHGFTGKAAVTRTAEPPSCQEGLVY